MTDSRYAWESTFGYSNTRVGICWNCKKGFVWTIKNGPKTGEAHCKLCETPLAQTTMLSKLRFEQVTPNGCGTTHTKTGKAKTAPICSRPE